MVHANHKTLLLAEWQAGIKRNPMLKKLLNMLNDNHTKNKLDAHLRGETKCRLITCKA